MRWVYEPVALTRHSCNRELPVGAEGFSCPRACYLLFPAFFVTVSPASGEENTNFCKLSVKEELQRFWGHGRNRHALSLRCFVLWLPCSLARCAPGSRRLLSC